MDVFLDTCISTLTQGLIYALLSCGIYITYKILDFPDLTVDGSFPLGAAVTAVLLTRGVNPWLTLAVAMGVWISRFYFKAVAYICPQCHQVFKPRFKEAFFARHTPKLRRLTCPHCGVKSFCIETCDETSN